MHGTLQLFDPVWRGLYGLPMPLRTVVLIALPLASCVLLVTLVSPAGRGARAWIARRWLLAGLVAFVSLLAAVSHEVWKAAQPDPQALFPRIRRIEGSVPVGLAALALSMICALLVERGWMSEESDDD